MRVALAHGLRGQILAQARAAYPGECCGLLTGVRDGDVARILALYPARNLARDDDRFQVDPADHIAAQKHARTQGHMVLGCYHSHPNGLAQPSATDLAGAGEPGFLWLIAAGDTLNAFVYGRGAFTGVDWL